LKVKSDSTEILLLSAGLSASFIMLLGAAFSAISRLIVYERPISEIPLMLLLASSIGSLCVICYLRSKDFSMTFCLAHKFPLFSLLSLWLIPLSTYGTYQLIAHGNNVFLLVLYAIISVIPLLVALNKIPKEIHPLVIWSISASLLIPAFGSLTSVSETLMPNVIVRQGVWNPDLHHGQNALLDAVLQCVFFYICGFENILSELKVVVPFFYSLTPVALYQLFKKETDERTAFLSSFLFMSWFWYFCFAGDTAPRQKFAELFVCLLLLSVFNGRLEPVKKSFLSIIFAFSVIVSHYGTSYLLMFSLVLAFSIMFLVEKTGFSKNRQNLSSFTFMSLYVVMALSWYAWVAGSANFITLINFCKFFLEHLSELFSLEVSHALFSLSREWNSLSIELTKYLLIFVCILTAVGILNSLRDSLKQKRIDEYLTLSAMFLVMLGSTLLPIGGGFDTSRIFHITLILLAPFSVIGLKIMFGHLGIKNEYLIAFAALVSVFLLLNSGFVAEFFPNDYSPNSLVNKKKIMEENNIYGKQILYRLGYMPPENVQASEWMMECSNTKAKVYSDRIGWSILKTSKYGQLPEEIGESLPQPILLDKDTIIDNSSYVFLGCHNNIEKLLFVNPKELVFLSLDRVPLEDMSKIYDNGGSTIFITDRTADLEKS